MEGRKHSQHLKAGTALLLIDFYLNLKDALTLTGALFVIIGGIIAVYVYWARQRFATGKWNVRSVSFYPPELVKNIKFEVIDWQRAPPGKTLPPETLSVSAPDDGSYVPVGGLTQVSLKREINPPAIVLHFVAVNPSIIPIAIKEMVLTVKSPDGRESQFMPTHFGKKDAPDDSRVPGGLPFDEFWGPILIQPTTSSEHRLVFVPKLPLQDNIFYGLTEGEYKFTIEFRFERLFRSTKRKEKSRRISFKFDVDEIMEENWKHNKTVTVPYSLFLDV